MTNCTHEHVELRARTYTNGAVTHTLQCLKCGAATRSIAKDKSIIPPPFDDGLRERWEQIYAEESAKKIHQRRVAYNQYLNSPEWAAKRTKRLAWDHYVCQGCGAPAEQVHHLTYARLGCELLLDLVSVCRNCHEVIHA
jgi:5-methylcytosine-specific restriction endonuclease McrA